MVDAKFKAWVDSEVKGVLAHKLGQAAAEYATKRCGQLLLDGHAPTSLIAKEIEIAYSRGQVQAAEVIFALFDEARTK